MFLHIETTTKVGNNYIAAFHGCEDNKGQCKIIWQESRFFGATAPTADSLRTALSQRFQEIAGVAPEKVMAIGQTHPKPVPPPEPAPPVIPPFDLVKKGEPTLRGGVASLTFTVLRDGKAVGSLVAFGATSQEFAADKATKFAEAQAKILAAETALAAAQAIVG